MPIDIKKISIFFPLATIPMIHQKVVELGSMILCCKQLDLLSQTFYVGTLSNSLIDYSPGFALFELFRGF